ncbi:MAG: MFS transporter [Eubacteriales bacterium]|nr:MFS transporter [Eubacteriales bacterium]
MNTKEKLNYRRTLLLGFGFLASSLAWSLYNALVPPMLESRFLLSTGTIGVIMTIDNIFGVVFQPLVGSLSDRTRSRYGKRMPWIILALPCSALFFYLIPGANTLVKMMTMIIAFNFFMSLWRSPVIALMPDLTPPALRSKANGLINLMGGIGAIIAFFIGGRLALHDSSNRLSFLMGSITMLLSLLMLMLFVKEPSSLELKREVKSKSKNKISLSRSELNSLVKILAAIFFWFAAYNAIETFFTLYAVNKLGVASGTATMMLTAFSLSFVVFAFPAALVAGKLGRKKTILAGLVILLVCFLPILFLEEVKLILILLLIGGVGWAFININSLPMVVELASKDKLGEFTGFYYFASFSASIVSPILFGWIRDLSKDYSSLFVYALIAFFIALLLMLGVKHGEANPELSRGDVLTALDDAEI